VSTVAGFEGSTVIQFTAIDAQGAMGTGLMIIAVLPPPEAGDFDGDGRISLQDFFLLAEKQGLSDTHLNWNPVFDLDGDSKVDLEDFFRFADIFIANQRSTASP